MADRPKEGYSDGSDDGGNKTLRGFVLIRKSHGEKNGSMFAEHSRFHYGPGYPPGRGIFVSSTYRLIRDPQRYNLAVPCTHIVGICFQIDNHPFQRHDMTWLVPWAPEASHRPCATSSRQSARRTRFVKDERVAGGPKPCRSVEPPITCLRQCNTIHEVET